MKAAQKRTSHQASPTKALKMTVHQVQVRLLPNLRLPPHPSRQRLPLRLSSLSLLKARLSGHRLLHLSGLSKRSRHSNHSSPSSPSKLRQVSSPSKVRKHSRHRLQDQTETGSSSTDRASINRINIKMHYAFISMVLIQKYYKRFLGKTLLQKGYSPNPFPKTLNDFYPPMDKTIGG